MHGRMMVLASSIYWNWTLFLPQVVDIYLINIIGYLQKLNRSMVHASIVTMFLLGLI